MSKLNQTLSLIATTMAFAFTQGAIAQDAPKTRADVKAETKDAKAAKAGTPMTASTEVGATPMAPKTGTTRAEVKADTKKAKAEGKLGGPTESSAPASTPMKAMKSDKSRAEVKADTVKAAKDGKLSQGSAEK